MVALSQARKKFGIDLIWTYMSFAMLGGTGIILNFLIVYFFDTATLGAFNQIYALYIILAQIALLGINTSTLKHVSECAAGDKNLNSLFTASYACSLLTVGAFTALFYLTSPLLKHFFKSELVTQGWVLALPGLFFYAINKTLMATLNGLREMKLFSIAQIFRYVGILAGFFVCIGLKVSGEYLPLILVFPEVILFIVLSAYLFKRITPSFIDMMKWSKIHYLFGTKVFLSVAIAELNTRVDIIMLGYFTNDTLVGIYSIAAMCAEGIAMLITPLRDNLNPLLAKYYASNERQKLRDIIHKTKISVYSLMIFVVLVSLFVFPVVVGQFLEPEQAMNSFVVFAILLAGIAVASGYLPISLLLSQSGFPWQQTQLRVMIVLTNIALNIWMIQTYGIWGAAIATSLTYVMTVFYLKWLTYKHAAMVI